MNTSDRVVVTGSGGVLGTALVEELRVAGYENVVALTRAHGDLLSEQSCNGLFRKLEPDIVFHLAGRVSGILGNKTFGASLLLENLRINANVVEACRLVGVRKIVALGSVAVYSDLAPVPITEDALWYGPPHTSERAYGHAKRMLLAQLDACREHHDMDFAYCIPTNLYGPNDRFDEQYGHVVPSLISKFHRGTTSGGNVTVWGSGRATRDLLYSKDAATALRLVGESFSGSINLASGQSITINELVATLCRITKFTGQITWDTEKPDGQQVREYDIGRLKALGFRPAYSLEAGLSETYDWYCRNFLVARR